MHPQQALALVLAQALVLAWVLASAQALAQALVLASAQALVLALVLESAQALVLASAQASVQALVLESAQALVQALAQALVLAYRRLMCLCRSRLQRLATMKERLAIPPQHAYRPNRRYRLWKQNEGCPLLF